MTAALGLDDESEGRGSHETETLGKRRQGTVVAGTYRLGRCVGTGASSYVFEAEHLRLGRKFAVKVLRAELDGQRAAQRFRREALAIARLQSEHVVSVVDCGELADQTPYLVMELLDGEDLRRLLSHAAPLPARRALHLLTEACYGLHDVHRAGLVHRDLKPANLFVTRRSSGADWCKILDFGIAKMDASVGTAQGAILGTVRYMAPEQLIDTSDVGPATDLHALAAILFECLTGRPLISGASVQEMMFQIINASPRDLVGRGNVPARLEPILLSCLDKSPEHRPASAGELARLLTGAVTATVSAFDTTVIEADERPPSERGRMGAKPGALALGAFATTLVGALGGWQLSTQAPSPSVFSSQPLAPRQEPSATARVEVPQTTPVTATTDGSPRLSPAVSASPPSASAATPIPNRKLASPPRPSSKTIEPPPATPLDRFDRANPYGD